MSLHIKTIETMHNSMRVFATLSLENTAGVVGVKVRVSSIKRGNKEIFRGYATLAADGSLIDASSELDQAERDAVHKAILGALA